LSVIIDDSSKPAEDHLAVQKSDPASSALSVTLNNVSLQTGDHPALQGSNPVANPSSITFDDGIDSPKHATNQGYRRIIENYFLCFYTSPTNV
jgi:hypothetical protein